MPDDDAPRIETVEIEGRSGHARGHLRLPPRGGPHPAVLLCPGAPVEAPDFGPLLEEIAAALTDAGLATVLIESRLADRATARTTPAGALVDDADALLGWLASRSDVDPTRIAAVAYSTGTLAAAALCGRRELNGIGFIAPASPEQLVRWMERGDDETAIEDTIAASYRALDCTGDASRQPISTLVIQGAAEVAGGGSAGPAFVEGLIAGGVTPQSLIVAHADHAFATVEGRLACLDQVIAFCSGLPARPVPAATS